VLHLAAQFGDKNFCTMLVMEAEELRNGKKDSKLNIIDVEDRNNLTPLYLLCEEGFRKSQNFTEEEEVIYHDIIDR